MKKVDFPFNVMAFPAGPKCNLACRYCYYLYKDNLYSENDNLEMDDEILEKFIKQYSEAHPGPVISFGWQGGEPTLRGINFFEKVLNLEKKYVPDNMKFENNLQTNGTLINKEWAEFLAKNDFLVGISIDGPKDLHNSYRVNREGRGSFQEVREGLHRLQEYGVKYNVLCAVHDKNVDYPGRIYEFFRNEGVEHIQFIPIVEPREGVEAVGPETVSPSKYGKFLIGIFDEWIKKDYGKIFIQIFEECVSAWAGYGNNLCIFSERCGRAPVIEHNGDVYNCDHFVFPEFKLGNIKEKQLAELISSKQLQQFGESKKRKLPKVCRECKYRFICAGGCLKNRIVPSGGSNNADLNYLCPAYRQFFDYVNPFMNKIREGIKQNQSPVVIKKQLQQLHDSIWKDIGRNDPCPCGSGDKYKKCCLDRKQDY